MPARRPSLATQTVLAEFLANSGEELFGLAIARASGLKSGTLYPVLARLEADGWLTSRWEPIDEHAEGRRRRRLYRLTSIGEMRAREAQRETATRLRFAEIGLQT